MIATLRAYRKLLQCKTEYIEGIQEVESGKGM